MAALLERDEWKAFSDFLALGGAALCVIIGLILALAGEDRVIAFHGCVLLGAAALAFLFVLTQIIEKKETHDATSYADGCLLYTSDAADDLTRVDLGGRSIITKK